MKDCGSGTFPVSYFQSEHYYRVIKALGQKPFLISATLEGRLAGYWLLYESPQNFHLRGKHTRKPFSWLLRGLTALHGPVIITDKSSTYLEYLTSFAKELQKTVIEGHYLFNTFVAPLYDHMYRAEALDGILADLGFCVEDTFTFLLSLEGSIDEIHARLPKETRNKLNRAARQEIKTGEGSSEDDLGEYYRARCENMKRNSVECTPYDYYLTQWRILHDSSVMKLFIARSEGKVLAGQLAFLFGEVVHLAGVAVSDYCIHHRLAGNDALQWAVIEWARRNGYKIIDYTGAHPHTTDEKLKAIHAFKARWGGTLTRYQTFRYNSRSWRRQLLELYRCMKTRVT
jgi:lipid II:glycine glycyltransferase (peptidoglycan interpeptide bridge formation enzyme)